MGFIDPGMWDDARIANRSDAAKLLWIYLLTGPESVGLPGLLRVGIGGLAEAMRKEHDPDWIRKALQELDDAKLLFAEPVLRVIRIPNAPKYNVPRNPNFVRGWFRKWKQIPDCQHKFNHISSLSDVVGRLIEKGNKKDGGFWKAAWDETFGSVDQPRVERQRSLFPSNGSNNGSNRSGNGSSDWEKSAAEGTGSWSSDQPHGVRSSSVGNQDVKPFAVERCPDPDPDPSPGSLSEIPVRIRADGSQSGQVADLEPCRKLWELQEELIAKATGGRRLEPTQGNLELVARCLSDTGATHDMAARVLRSFAAGGSSFMNRSSNWKPSVFMVEVQKVSKNVRGGSQYTPSGEENYDEGGTEMPEFGPGVRQML